MGTVLGGPVFDPSDRSAVRIGDCEREAAITAPGEHLTAGQLSLDEYGQRSAVAAAAQTRDELSALFDDLPEPHPLAASGALPVRAAPDEAGVPAVPGSRAPAQRAVAASVGVLWAVGVPLVFILWLPWWLIFVPVAISAFAGRYWGDHWRGHDGRQRERHRDR
ncbi:MAG: hypothetical protein JWN35_1718 [Frankiales bacterium]|nr:hypothetical protein [Frankiales bacterium]